MSFLTKMLGLDKVKEINKAKEEEKNKQLSPKELATKKKEPWVGVIPVSYTHLTLPTILRV